MEIKNIGQSALDPYRTRVDKDPQAHSQRMRQTENATQSQGGDRVSFSPEARLLTEAYTTAMKTPDVRQEKIDELKERIASGQYSVDAKDIAKKLLQTEAEFASTEKG